MAGKSIEPEELELNANATAIEAEVEESAQVSPEVTEQVRSLVERASKSRAWASAEEYFRRRFQGADLEYALEALAQAERETNEHAEAA